MKKIVLMILLCIAPYVVDASSGTLIQKSVITCNNIMYGYHGNDKHYHQAILNKNGQYIAFGESFGTTAPCQVAKKENEREVVTLKVCVDGDTAKFITRQGIATTRLLAVDTPESVHPTLGEERYGKEASAFTCNKLQQANEIVLEYDQESDKFDKYDRLLAWIWVDGHLLQNELVKEGLAEVAYLYGDYKWTSLLKDSENMAKMQKRNIWNDEMDILTNVEKNISKQENNTFLYTIMTCIGVILFSAFGIRKRIHR